MFFLGMKISASYFYPRPPGGGRPRHFHRQLGAGVISIHALRVEGDGDIINAFMKNVISIHALRVEGDRCGQGRRRRARNFYPRPPGGGRLSPSSCIAKAPRFLSTPSGWRATFVDRRLKLSLTRDFYPRPPGGGRQVLPAATARADQFLSTPSGWRATVQRVYKVDIDGEFLSTPSGWRATVAGMTVPWS